MKGWEACSNTIIVKRRDERRTDTAITHLRSAPIENGSHLHMAFKVTSLRNSASCSRGQIIAPVFGPPVRAVASGFGQHLNNWTLTTLRLLLRALRLTHRRGLSLPSAEFSVVNAFIRSNNVVRDLISRASDYGVNCIRFMNPFVPYCGSPCVVFVRDNVPEEHPRNLGAL